MGFHASQHGNHGVIWSGEIRSTGSKSAIRAQSAYPYLSENLRGVFPSANAWRRAIRGGEVFSGNCAIVSSTWLSAGMQLSWKVHSPSIPALSWPARFVYGYQDETLAIVWKQAGIATSGVKGKTLSSQLPGHPVHRLDRDTSGWVIVSQSESERIALHQHFVEHKIQKSYLALVVGNCPDYMTIRLPLDDKPCSSQIHKVQTGRWPLHGQASLVQVETTTGRTHQIRRHLSAIGHPIIGDSLYSGAERYQGSGLFLCAWHLGLTHPSTGQSIVCFGDPPRKFQRISWWQGGIEKLS